MKASGEPQRVVLVGAGHAHLHLLAQARRFTGRGHELVVVAPGPFWYSGLATGMLGGRYAAEEDQVDVEKLVQRAGGRFVQNRLAALDPASQMVRLESGQALRYDVLSLNLGSESSPLPGESDGVVAIKPLENLWRLRATLEREAQAGRELRVVVVGGGPSGCEIAANLHTLLGAKAETTLLAGSAELVPSFPPAAQVVLRKWLLSRGIRVRTGARLQNVQDKVATATGGERFAFDYLVNATGLRPPAVLGRLGLPLSDTGELLVDETLRSVGDSKVFGGGDCIHFLPKPLAKVGVFAVREAPVLSANLLATVEGRPMQEFCPQRNYLLVVNLGAGRGLAVWRDLHWFGRTAYWLKQWLDRSYLSKHRP